MEELCRKIGMPEEVTRTLLEIHRTLEYYPCLDLLTEEQTWAEGLAQLREALGEDPGGMKRLCCMLRCALRAKEDYTRLGIPENIYTATMAAFSRFVREHKDSYGSYGFDRGSWTPRQVSCRLFRIGQLEYELTALDGAPIVSLHIPTDVDLHPEVLVPSLRAGLSQLRQIFPDLADRPVWCHSWLLSPQLQEFLPEDANILQFQSLFDIDGQGVPGRDVLLWVFKNPRLPLAQLPENTSLQRKLKKFLLDGGEFLEGKGYLRLPV